MKDEALRLALEALEVATTPLAKDRQEVLRARAAIREALAQPEPGGVCGRCGGWVCDPIPELAQPEHSPNCALLKIPSKDCDCQDQQESVAITITGKLGNIYSFTGDYSLKKGDKVYTTPPHRKPLSDKELRVIENKINPNMRWRSSDEEGITLYPIEYYELVRAIEAAHGIKE